MKLEEIRALIDAASPLPWFIGMDMTPADNALMMAAPNLLSRLFHAAKALEVIATQDPNDPFDKPTRLGCVCLIAKTALRNLAAE